MRIDEIINEDAPDIDYYNRKHSVKPFYMDKGNPGIMSMSNDEIEAMAGPFLDKYNQAITDMEKEVDQGIYGPASKFILDNGEMFDDIMTYYQGMADGDPAWRHNMPSREFDTKYNVDDPREPRLQKPTSKDNPSADYKFQRPPKEPV